jgi:hypothetical protein
MVSDALEHLKMGLGLFLMVAGLALFLTTPVAIMFMAAHLADSMTPEFGNIAAGVSFILLSSVGLFLTVILASFVQEALEA